MFRKMLWKVADFSGVEVLTYAVLGSHFHLLIRVPEPEEPVSDEELVRRYGVLYANPSDFDTASAASVRAVLEEGGEEAENLRQYLLGRMHDVSLFMKCLKQRFSTWFNRTHERFGPLWSDRFKSVLLEGRGAVLQTMAAYIDLNAVRAGLVSDPKDYRFCGYAEAVAGRSRAIAGLRRIRGTTEAVVLEDYRGLLFGKGLDGRGGIDREEAVRVLREGGKLSAAALLRCRIRYFADGVVLGSENFVRERLDAVRRCRNRKTPPDVIGFGARGETEFVVVGGQRAKEPG